MYGILVLLILSWTTERKDDVYLPSNNSNTEEPTIYFVNTSFRNQLIEERLATYERMYDNSFRECNTKRSLTKEQEENFPRISELLANLRQQLVPYPNQYFKDRGIVLTVGLHQISFAKVNLKMIEHSSTHLPVQVNRILNKYCYRV